MSETIPLHPSAADIPGLKNLSLSELELIRSQMQEDMENKKLCFLEELKKQQSSVPDGLLEFLTQAVEKSLGVVKQEIASRSNLSHA